jgi:hypothetical protein
LPPDLYVSVPIFPEFVLVDKPVLAIDEMTSALTPTGKTRPWAKFSQAKIYRFRF